MAGVLRIQRPASDVRAATIAALASGKGQLHAPDYATADYAGGCSNPLIIEQQGAPHRALGRNCEPIREPSRTLSMLVPCRKCSTCRWRRRMLWTNRAVSEWNHSTRTWFVTLTYKPEEHYRLLLETIQRLQKDGVAFDTLSSKDQRRELMKAYADTARLFLMRLRAGLKQKGWDQVSFRHLMIPELHKSGALHWHMLVHEVSPSHPVRKDRIEAAWGHGFVNARLVKDEAAVRYVVKYLGKDDFGNLRNSKHYGNPPPVPLHDAPFTMAVYGSRPPPVIPGAAPNPGDELGSAPLEIREGDELGVCATGLHAGVACDCKVNADPAAIPWGNNGLPRLTVADVLQPDRVGPRPTRGWQEPRWKHARPRLPRRRTAEAVASPGDTSKP